MTHILIQSTGVICPAGLRGHTLHRPPDVGCSPVISTYNCVPLQEQGKRGRRREWGQILRYKRRRQQQVVDAESIERTGSKTYDSSIRKTSG